MEPVYFVVRNTVLAFLKALFRWRLEGVEKIPRSGPAIIAPNHISNFDPLCVAYLVDRARRRPRFLAKASLWKVGFLRWVLDGCRQIPVERGSGAMTPTAAAERALRAGEVVVVYPEGTITRNEDLTPMQGKTGVARLTLATGAPVYPVACWGAQWLIPKNRKGRYRFRMPISLIVGDAMTFPDMAERKNDREALQQITDQVVTKIDELVRELHRTHPGGATVPPLLPAKEDEKA